MSDDEIKTLCRRITTWDQSEVDQLLGQPAVDYAVGHEKDVRKLAREVALSFPFGPRWWRITSALKRVYPKNAAIKKRAAEIGKGRADGSIVQYNGRLVRCLAQEQ